MSLLSLFSSYLFKENMLINDENCPYQISNFKVQCSVEDVYKSGLAARNGKPLNVETWAGNKRR